MPARRAAATNQNAKVGQTIRRLRLDMGLSQRELARRANLSPTYLCFIENADPRAGRRLSEAALRALTPARK